MTAMMLFWKDALPALPTQPTPLPLVVKVLGYVVSWATTIYLLIVKNPPKLIVDHHAFKQVRAISIVANSIFLILIFGYLGNSAGGNTLSLLASTLTILGIVVFFIVAAWISRLLKNASIDVPISLLIGFLIYTLALSAGLTSAGVFLAVILTNPSNARAGTTLVTPMRYSVQIHVQGISTPQQESDLTFSKSSGQVNIGCDESRTVTMEFDLPNGATLVGEPKATWVNTANLSSADGRAQVDGLRILGQGHISGLPNQQLLFVKNCPGGGHGELVLSGTYRSPHQPEAKEVQFSNTISSENKGPLWVTLPPHFQIDFVQGVFQPLQADNGNKQTLKVTPENPATTSSDGHVSMILDVSQQRLGLQAQ